MAREHASLPTFITLQDSTAPMRAEAKAAGSYHHALMGRDYDEIQIVTVRELLENGKKRLDIPLSFEVLKKAPRRSGEDAQTSLKTGLIEVAQTCRFCCLRSATPLWRSFYLK
jgi:hypothetical protein